MDLWVLWVRFRKLKSKIKNPAINRFAGFFVDRPGFEPGQTAPKTVVLPLHHRSISVSGGKDIQNIFSNNIFLKNDIIF